MNRHKTREAWLNQAVNVLAAQVFKPQGVDMPKVIRVSTGWPRKVAKGSVGWCYKTSAAKDASTNIFVSPELEDPVKVLCVLTHELIHAADDCASKHGGFFAKTHKAVGLVDKPTACVPGDELRGLLHGIAAELGTYPHATLTHEGQTKTQTTRMLKVVCPDEDCGVIVRMTAKWLEEVGTPTCACGYRMTNEEYGFGGPEAEEPEDMEDNEAEDEES